MTRRRACGAEAPTTGTRCTRPHGHQGQHHAVDATGWRRWGGGGPTPPEAERRTVHVTLRLEPAQRDTLDALAGRLELSRSALVVWLVGTVEEQPPPPLPSATATR